MSNESVIVRCPQCGTKNRIPGSRWGGKAICAKCKAHLHLSSLYPDRPINITDATFEEEVARFPGTVLIDFTAPW